MSTFAELGASAPVVKALDERGIATPFPIQESVIPDALAGRDVLAMSRTGSGKTLAFAIPIVERIDRSQSGPAALILVPTRELAVQVTEEFRGIATGKGVRVAAVFGGVPLPRQAEKAARAHVIIATPGRLDDLVNRRMISLDRIGTLVLDEADRMLDMGFQPQVDRIVNRLKGRRQTLFFSATLEGTVLRLASAYTRDAVRHEAAHEQPRLQDAKHRFVQVTDTGKVDALVDILQEEGELALVFVRTKRGADRLGHKLKGRGLPAVVLHGDMTQGQRQRSLDRFGVDGPKVMVATDVAARGIHLDDITHVVNFDAPADKDTYVHRTGRTARAGRGGTAVTFIGPLQLREVGLIASALDLKDEFEASGLKLPPPVRVFSSAGGRRRRTGARRR